MKNASVCVRRVHYPTVNSNKAFQNMSAHACMCVPACVCVCVSVVLLYTARESALSSSIVDRGHKGTVNEPGTLLLLLKLKTQRDLHGNESVS